MNESRVQLQPLVCSQAHPLDRARGQVLDEHVCCGEQFFQDCHAFFRFQIQDEAFLATVRPDKIAAMPCTFVS